MMWVMPTRTIQSVSDLAQLPDDELLGCIGALRAAIHEAKRRHAIARRQDPAMDSRFTFTSFDWSPRGVQRLSTPVRLTPATPIDEISVRASAREALKELNIFCIEDLAEISEQELLKEEAIGPKTLARLREILARVRLDFLPNPNSEEGERSRAE
jgi:Bacterial RNA polymerase, alpha chain C terminal domain